MPQQPQPQSGTLAQRMRAKYPGSYDDLDDRALEAAILKKHPDYADLATKDHPHAKVGRMVMENLPTVGAIAGGLLAMPLTGGLSLPAVALAEGAAAGLGAFAGHVTDQAVTGRAQENIPGSLGTNAVLGAAGPVAGRALGAAARGVASGVRKSPSLALDAAELIPGGIGKMVRGVRMGGRIMDAIAPEASHASAAPRAARSFDDIAAEATKDSTLGPYRPPSQRPPLSEPKITEAPPKPARVVQASAPKAEQTGPSPVDDAGRDLGGYAGPERRARTRPPASEDARYQADREQRARINGRPQTSQAAKENAAMRAEREAQLPESWKKFAQPESKAPAKPAAGRGPTHLDDPAMHTPMWGRPPESSGNAAAEMRSMYGADEAGRRMGLSGDAVREASGRLSKQRPAVANLADMDNDYRRKLMDPKAGAIPPFIIAAMLQQLMGEPER